MAVATSVEPKSCTPQIHPIRCGQMKSLPILCIFLSADLSLCEPVITTKPEGASVFVDGRLKGNTSEGIRLSEDEWEGEVIVHKNDFQAMVIEKSDTDVAIHLKPYPRITSTGIPLVDVPIKDAGDKTLYTVQFAVWETRTKDFEAFAEYVQSHLSESHSKYVLAETEPAYRKHRSSVFDGEEVTPNHPVVCVTRQSAQGFCEWLTKTDRSKGIIPNDYVYRLPSDMEWSAAALVEEDRNPDLSPFKREKTAVLPAISRYEGYPNYPLGNLKGSEYERNEISHTGILEVDDGYVKTCPVGQFAPNSFGIFDLLGNVYEKCLDLRYDDKEAYESWMLDSYVDRGSAYDRFRPNLTARYGGYGEEAGFRIVLAQVDIMPYGYHGERPTKSYAKRLESMRQLNTAALESKPEWEDTSKPDSEDDTRSQLNETPAHE